MYRRIAILLHMGIKLHNNMKLSYTHREIMEDEFQPLWESAEKYVEHLAKVQTKIVEILPKYKSLLPREYAELQDKESRLHLLDYIRLRSIYAFTNEAFRTLDQLCDSLADAREHHDEEGINMESLRIRKLCNTLLDDFIEDDVTGFPNLIDKSKDLRKDSIIYDWIVFKTENGATCSFADIVGTINTNGVCCERLWESAVNDKLPEMETLGKLLASDE